MKTAAIGVRMHSGWGALVAVSNDGGTLEIIDRQRVSLTTSGARGGNQPGFKTLCRSDKPNLRSVALDQLARYGERGNHVAASASACDQDPQAILCHDWGPMRVSRSPG